MISVVVFALVSSLLLVFTRAASTSNKAYEAEAGTVTGKSAIVVHAESSGGGITLNSTRGDDNIVRAIAHGPFVPYTNTVDSQNNGTYELFAEAKVQALRIGLPWREMQPQAKGVWDENFIAQVDTFINRVSSMGIKLLVVVVGSPGWSSGGGEFNSQNFKDEDYADYLQQIIERYPEKIEAIEVWNEPSYSGFLANSDPARYTRLLKAAYTRVKQVDPNVIVVGGSLYGSVYNNPEFLRGMYENGAKNYFDVFATHEYGDTPARADVWGESVPPAPYIKLFTSIKNNLVSIMEEFGDGAKPIWMTETGANTAKGGNGVTEAQQAQAMNDAYRHLKNGTIPQLKRIYWYNWSDGWTNGPGNDANGTNPEWKYGIVTPNSGPFPTPGDWIRKPAFDAFKNL